jgi:nicotinamide-nucleotide amidase
MWFEKEGKVFVSMPGVPREMKYMMTDTVLPRLQKQFKMPIIIHQMVKTSGIPESDLAQKLEDWEDNLPAAIKLAYLPGLKQVKLRLTASGNDKKELESLIAKEVTKLERLAGKYIFAKEEISLAEAVGRLLLAQSKTIACAESCTGGYLSKLITENTGSSAYYQGTVIPYHNDLKVQVLGVKSQTIAQFGAVSAETVIEMAENVRKLLHADIGVATSGIAGPGGGSEEKPVGTVWIALADGVKTQTKLFHFPFDREGNIDITSNSVLNLVRQTLTSK